MNHASPIDVRGPARIRPVACLALAVALALGGRATAATRTIVVEGMVYVPASLTVQRGDRVVWINKDPFPHTVTAADRTFDSGSIAAGGSWTYVPRKPGGFDYVCTFHPGMKARLEVR